LSTRRPLTGGRAPSGTAWTTPEGSPALVPPRGQALPGSDGS